MKRLSIPALLVLVAALAAPASAVQTTYRWQISNGATYGGFTTNWAETCGNNPPDITATAVTTMTTDPFCDVEPGRLATTEASPFDMLLMIKPTAYAQATVVTGVNMRWRIRDRGGNGFTMRFHIGYVQGGTFTGFGWVERSVAGDGDVLYLPDTSAISGTAPSGSYLAVLAELVNNGNGNEVRIYFADDRDPGDQSGEVTVDETVAANDTVLGDGTNPAGASVCPAGVAADLDAFTLATTGGTDTVTALQVTLSAGSAAHLSLVEITSDDGATVFGSVANPAADVVDVTLGTAISVTTTAVQYRVRITPLGHGAMPAPPGAEQAVTGTVTAVTAGNTVTGSDSASATVTVDNLSPGNPVWGTVTPADGQLTLNWTNPTDADFAGVVVLRDTAAVTAAPAEGTTYTAGQTIGTATVVYVGTGTTFTDTGLVNGTDYYYAVFSRDTCVNHSTGAGTGPHTPRVPVNPVTTGTPSASADACDRITVTAPFTYDDNGNSTTLVERGSTASGPWTTVCSGLTGPSPRTCTDTGLSQLTSYYYRVTFSDPDGVNGTNPQVVGPVTTPVCTVDDTTVVGSDVLVSSCTQLTVTSRFTGDENGDGSTRVEYSTANAWPGTVACDAVAGGNPRQCLIPGLTEGQTYWVRVTFSDPDGVSGPSPEVLGPFTLPTCTADATPPTALFVVPTQGAVVGGTDRFKVQVWDEGGLGATPLRWYVDGGTASTAAVTNTNYDCGTGCTVWEFDVDLTALARGWHEVTVEVTDAAGNVGRAVRGFWVRNRGTKPAGSGQLLRRTHGSQLCVDCHALATHSSQHTGTRYGNWAVDCLTCHTPHQTLNIYLIRKDLQTPNSGTKSITFWEDDRSGGTNPNRSYLGVTFPDPAPTDDGICEACHTRTSYHRNDGSVDRTHNADRRCVSCHPHSQGFAATESKGGVTCAGCHPGIWEGMTGAVAKTSRHTLGSVLGVNDDFNDSGVSWTAPLSGVAPADRSCVNMCHQDHVHNQPGGTSHDFNVHRDASTQASRAVGRNTGGEIISGTPARTDFDPGQANGGMCVSCHRNAVSTGRPSIDAAAYAASAHNYTANSLATWTYDLHDGSSFDRNCTKCHADRNDGRPAESTAPFGAVHFSDYPKLLSGSTNPAGTAADFVCYTCHGNGATGVDLSGKDLATVVAKAAAHPVESDAVHDTVAEGGATYNDGTFSGANRHVNCLDCHDTHRAQAGLHTPGSTVLAGALTGATGIGVLNLPAEWAVFGAADLSTSPQAATAEYQVCLKCHSSFAYGTTPPAGQTDQAREFNVNNDSYHWVMTDQAATQAPDWTTANDTPRTNSTSRYMTFTAGSGWTKSSPMVCSDCHGNDDPAQAQGPHGSNNPKILKKPWNAGSGTTDANGLCFDCHDYQTYAGQDDTVGVSGFSRRRGGGTYRNLHATHSSEFNGNMLCAWCHSAVPHGWNRKALVVLTSDPAPYNAGGNTSRLVAWSISNSRSYRFSSCSTAGGCH